MGPPRGQGKMLSSCGGARNVGTCSGGTPGPSGGAGTSSGAGPLNVVVPATTISLSTECRGVGGCSK